MILYDSPVSGNCYKVRLLAAHLGLPLERRALDVVDRSNRPEVIGDLNPALRVPTLVLDDGRPLGESGAILWYLGARHALRAGGRLRARAGAAVDVLRAVRPRAEHRRRALPGSCTRRASPSSTPTGCPRCTRAATRALAALERHLGGDRDYLVGDRLSIADIALYGYTHVAEEGGFDLGRYPAVRAWIARVAAEPGHIPIDA